MLTELLFIFVRATLWLFFVEKKLNLTEKETKSRGLFADVGSVTSAFLRVVQQWFRGQTVNQMEINNGPGFILIEVGTLFNVATAFCSFR